MNRFSLRKSAGALVSFDEGQRLFAGSTYGVDVSAPEFRKDTESAAELVLAAGGVRVAACTLVPDPLRRGRRVSTGAGGHLVVPAYGENVPVAVQVTLGTDVLVYVDSRVTGVPGGAPAPSGSRWTVVDLGRVTDGAVALSDMTQVKLTAPVASVPLSITAGSPLDAYVVVVGEGLSRFPFTEVLVNGAAPVWTHQDSLSMPAQKWVLRIVKVADNYYADLRAGRPGGTELDPDGAAVVSAEVNS